MNYILAVFVALSGLSFVDCQVQSTALLSSDSCNCTVCTVGELSCSIPTIGQELDCSEVKYQLYTRENNASGGQPLREGNYTGVKNGVFVVVIIHGWLGDGKTDGVIKLKDASLEKQDCNVIIVDWSSCAKNIVYSVAAKCVDKLGKCIALFLIPWIMNGGLQIAKLCIVGHSLGAHAAGQTGSEIFNRGNGKVGTICEESVRKVYECGPGAFESSDRLGNLSTGLDPAGPCFKNKPIGHQISVADAQRVKCIHTNCNCYGLEKPSGGEDYYANGCSKQPGCNTNNRCRHLAAYVYASETTTNPRMYPACKCKSVDDAIQQNQANCNGPLAYMGCDCFNITGKFENGIYYVNTITRSCN